MKNALAILVLSTFTLLTSTEAMATSCEKWKSEIAWAVKDIGSYIVAYNSYSNNKISEGAFTDKANDAIKDLRKIKDRVQSVSSCSGDNNKFEHRRDALLEALNISLPIMSGGKFLASSVKEHLQKHED